MWVMISGEWASVIGPACGLPQGEGQAPAARLSLPQERVHGAVMRTGLTIGEFAQLTQLRIRTLRRYHQGGLLGPVREAYLVGSRDTADPDSWRAEIGWPVFRVSPI